MAAKASPYQNRIVGHGSKPASQFVANPANWRTHPQNQRDALAASLREVGWVQDVIENTRTGNLVDGHERIWQALKNGDAVVPFVQVDLSEAEEALVLATLDPIGAMAQADAAKLAELLADVNTGEAALQELLASMAGPLYLDSDSDRTGADFQRGLGQNSGMIVNLGRFSGYVQGISGLDDRLITRFGEGDAAIVSFLDSLNTWLEQG